MDLQKLAEAIVTELLGSVGVTCGIGSEEYIRSELERRGEVRRAEVQRVKSMISDAMNAGGNQPGGA